MIAAPRVSVVIATHNRAGLVVEAVQSVLGQSFRDLEVIVADDGSTDDTADRIAALDGPVEYLALPRSGIIARIRNAGLRRARGELIAFLDDDDSWVREKLGRQVAALDAEPAVGLVYTGFSILAEDGSSHVPELAPWQTAPGPLLDRLLRGCFIPTSTVVVRRALLERIGGFDEERRPCEDYDLMLRLAPLTPGICLAEPLTRLRRGGANTSATRDRHLIFQTSISILEDLLASGTLDLTQRLRCRAAISNLHVSAAGRASERGDAREARRHAVSALRRNPVEPRAWKAAREHVRPTPRR